MLRLVSTEKDAGSIPGFGCYFSLEKLWVLLTLFDRDFAGSSSREWDTKMARSAAHLSAGVNIYIYKDT